MIEKPKNNRSQLGRYQFERKDSNNWFFCIKEYYARLFSELHQSIMRMSNTGWKDTKTPLYQYAFFKGLTDKDIEVIKGFINVFSQRVIINVGKNINKDFSNELDFCIALDFTFEEGNPKKRTETHEFVHQAKNYGSQKALNNLVEPLIACVKDMNKLVSAGTKCLSCVPVSDSKRIDVPRKLVELIKDDLIQYSIVGSGHPVVQAILISDKRGLKNLRISSKVSEWRKIYENSGVQLDCSVSGATVYIIDDLYQSGATLWSYARFLKSQGAVRTIGVVCVKTWSDGDNK